MGDDRPARYVEDNKVVYRASAFGTCANIFVYLGQGMDPVGTPDWLQVRFDEGNLVELPILQRAIPDLDKYDLQAEVEIALLPDVVVRGHLDAMSKAEGTIVEVKGFRDALWAKWKREGLRGFPSYEWQVAIYMLATGLPCWFVVGHKEDKEGELVISEIDSTLIQTPPYSMLQLKKRAADLEELVELNETGVCNPLVYPCPFYYMHDDKAEGTRESAERVDDAILARLVADFTVATVTLRRAEAARKAIGLGIQGWMEANGLAGNKIQVGEYTVTDQFVPQPAKTVKAFTQHYILVRKGKA